MWTVSGVPSKKYIMNLENDCIPRKKVYINGNLSKKNLSTPMDQKSLRKVKQKNRIWSKKA